MKGPMRIRKMLAVIAVIAAIAAVAPLSAGQTLPDANTWKIDPSHSAANFSVRHLMISTVRGKLGPVNGTV